MFSNDIDAVRYWCLLQHQWSRLHRDFLLYWALTGSSNRLAEQNLSGLLGKLWGQVLVSFPPGCVSFQTSVYVIFFMYLTFLEFAINPLFQLNFFIFRHLISCIFEIKSYKCSGIITFKLVVILILVIFFLIFFLCENLFAIYLSVSNLLVIRLRLIKESP